MKKALFIRLDRMGDLILTLPCENLIRDTHQVHWVTPRGLDFVTKQSQPQKTFTSFTKEFSLKDFISFCRLIKSQKPEVSISFHVPWWINFALWLMRVKKRGGVLSQWHSYLFLNKGLRQKRSQCEHHELEYNYLLVEFVFGLKKDSRQWVPLTLTEPETHEMNFDTTQHYFVVHPGMGGSALNWSPKQYAQLIHSLTDRANVVITGTQSDDVYLKPIKQLLKENNRVVWLDKQLNGYQLLKLLNNAIANIAPSTGVLHLSASLGAPSIGVYSPIRVHQDKRWGPKGKDVACYSPTVPCPAHFECLEKACPQYFCMQKMPIEAVLTKALSYL